MVFSLIWKKSEYNKEVTVTSQNILIIDIDIGYRYTYEMPSFHVFNAFAREHSGNVTRKGLSIICMSV